MANRDNAAYISWRRMRQHVTHREDYALVRSHGTGGWQTANDMCVFARAVLAAAQEQPR